LCVVHRPDVSHKTEFYTYAEVFSHIAQNAIKSLAYCRFLTVNYLVWPTRKPLVLEERFGVVNGENPLRPEPHPRLWAMGILARSGALHIDPEKRTAIG
jgi:hypothetical protein